MITPIDQGSQPLSGYLLKLLTIIVRDMPQQELRIDARRLLDDNSGQGLLRYYDRSTGEIVLSFAPVGADLYFIRPEDSQCQSNNQHPTRTPDGRAMPPGNGSSPPTTSPLTNPTRVVNLSDEALAEMEDRRNREAALRTISNFPSAPASDPSTFRVRSAPLRQPPSQPQQEPEAARVPREFWKS